MEIDPNAYATHAEAKEDPAKYSFNCAQRAHSNYLEHQPQMIIPLLVRPFGAFCFPSGPFRVFKKRVTRIS